MFVLCAYAAATPDCDAEVVPAREVVFVDAAVADHETLLMGVRPGVETVLLDPAGNELAQMAAWADAHSGYAAIHVFSHGAPGALRLGAASLDGDALRRPAVAGELARLGRALNRGGDLLLYGCDLAAGSEGEAFVDALAQVAGADVAASTDQTGAAARAGNWRLEYATGPIEVASAAAPAALDHYSGVLAVTERTIHTFTGASWAYSQLAHDSTGAFYVIHKADATTLSLKKWNGTDWVVQATITAAGVGETSFSDDLGIAIDGSNHIHIVYRWSNGTGVTSLRGVGYGYYNGSTWSYTRVEGYSDPAGGKNFSRPKLAVDSSGKAHVLYQYSSEGNTNVQYATNVSGSWNINKLVTGVGGTDEAMPVAIRAVNGAIYAFYNKEDNQNSYTGNLYCVIYTGETRGETMKVIDGVGDGKSYAPYLAEVTPDGAIHLLYGFTSYAATPSTSTIYHRTNASGSWVTSTVDSASGSSVSVSALTADGNDLYAMLSTCTADGVTYRARYATLPSGKASWVLGQPFSFAIAPYGYGELAFDVNSTGALAGVCENEAGYDADWNEIYPGLTYIGAQVGTYADYFAGTAPTVTGVSPTSGPTAGGTTVTVTGTNFANVTAVKFGATVAASYTVNSATSITTTSPAGGAGAVDVTVTTADGTSTTSASDLFTYVAAPAVTGVSPSSGSTAGGTAVTITGTGFTNAMAVKFGATGAASYTVNSATSIAATAPAGAAGTVDVTVTTPYGTSATGASARFTYMAAPVLSGVDASAPVYTEGGAPVVLDSAVVVSDADNTTQASATVAVATGLAAGDTLTFTNTSAVTYGNIQGSWNSGSGILTLTSAGATATLAQWQAALRAVTFSSSSDDPTAASASRMINWRINDGATDSAVLASSLTLVAVNDAPSLSAAGGMPTYTENGAAVALFSGAAVSTVEPGQTIAGLTLTVSSVDGAGEILTVDGAPVALTNANSLVTSTNGLSVSVTVGGGTATVTLSGGALSPSATQTLINSLAYRNSSEAPTAGSRTVTLTSVRDSGGTDNGGADTTTLTTAATVTVVAVNDAPTITAPASVAVTEDTSSALTGIGFADVDAGSASAAATLSVGTGTLAATSGGGVAVMGGGTASLSLVGSVANLNSFIAAGGVTFTPASNATADVTLAVGIDDGGASGTGGAKSASTTVTLAVSAVNDAPVNSVPAAQTTDQDQALTFNLTNGNLLSVADVDAGGAPLQVSLTATHGTVTLSSMAGLVFAVGSGTGDATMTFIGALPDLNTALDGLRFTPTAGYNGPASLQITTNDQGNTGSGGVQSDSDTIAITVSPLNPKVTAVDSSSADGSYKLGTTVSLLVQFDHDVTVDTAGGTPTLILETGTTDRAATYVSGSATTTLIFTYTVQTGDESSDLDYVSTGSLTLNGATIRSASNMDAVLTLPAVGGPDSLGGRNSLIIDGVAPAAPVVTAAGTSAITGRAEPGSTVIASVGGSVVGAATADASTGVWTCVPTTPLVAGTTYGITAVATDAAGNESARSAVFTVTIQDSGNTWMVTTAADDVASPASGSLRYALEQAASGDTILFADRSIILLAGPLPPITCDLTIDGGTLGDVVIDGAGAYRVFFVDQGTVALKNLWIQNASAQGGAGGSGDGGGGGGAGLGAGLFVNQATADVTVTNVSFISMHAVGGAGGAFVSQAYAGAGGGGMGYRGGSTTVNGAGPGGGGMLAPGADVMSGLNGGAGGAGGGGGGGRRQYGLSGLGGSAYAGNDAGSAGTTPSGSVDGAGGAGGFGGGGGGAAVASGGAGGFGGGGGGTGSNTPGGAGGPGGGGGGGDGYAVAAPGGSLGAGVSGGQSGIGSGAGGGGGAAAGPAIFVRLGTLTTINCAWDTATATGGAGGSGQSSHDGAAGTADATPTFNYAGTVNGSTTTGPVPDALVACVPVLSSVVLVSDGANASYATAGDTVTLNFTASRPIYVPDLTLGGHAISATSTGGNGWTASFTVAETDSEGPVAFEVEFHSTDGFHGTNVTATTDGSTVTIDLTAPETALTTTPAARSNSDTVTFVFSGDDGAGSGVSAFEASADSAGYVAATSPMVLTGLADGTHTIAIRAIDAAGNVDATPASFTWTIDTAAPSAPTTPTLPAAITSDARPTVSGTAEAGSTVTIYVDGTAVGTTTADASTGAWSFSLPSVLVDGTHAVTVTSTDAAGNTSTASPAGEVTIDTINPVLATLTRLQPGPVTTADVVSWRVTFSEAVMGIDVADFTLVPATGTVTGSITSVTGSGSEYVVSAVLSGVGTLRLDLNASGTGIVDAAGNALAGGFTLGQRYTHVSGSVPLAWGCGYYGMLGNGGIADAGTSSSLEPVAVDGSGALSGKAVVSLAAGWFHSVALAQDGTVYSWGGNEYGQLGNGDLGVTASSVPVAVKLDGALAGKTVVAVAVGDHHTLALASDGTVYAWGWNNYGELGNGFSGAGSDSSVPVPVVMTGALAGKKVVALAAGAWFSLALASDGTVYAWGWGGFGALGNGAEDSSSVPVAVKMDGVLAGKSVVALAAGEGHGLALASDGNVYAWGRNDAGQLGNGGSPTSSLEPVAVATTGALAGKTVVTIAAGLHQSLAVASDGRTYAWGSNGDGRLGLGDDSVANSPVPVAVATDGVLAGKQVVDVTGGFYHSLVLASDGTAAGWGNNQYGQLGNGGYDESNATPVATATDASSALRGRVIYLLGQGCASFHSLALASPLSAASVAVPATGAYKAGAALHFTVNFAQALTVDTTGGTPRMELKIGSTTAYATYASGSGTTMLVFTYTVQPGDADSDGLTVTSTAISPNGGTITDAAGWPVGLDLPNTSLPAVIVDTSAPDTAVGSTPPPLSSNASADFTFSGSDGSGSGVAGFEASLDGGAYAAVTSPLTLTGLADGSHTFSVRAIDAAGNVDATPASFTWTIDTTAPSAPTIASITPTGVSGTAEPGSTVRVYAGATLLGTTTADSSGNWSLALPLADGAYSLTATAFDAAGNRTAMTVPITHTVDTVAPLLTVVTVLSDNATPTLAKVGDTIALSFTTSEAIQAPTVILADETVTAAFDSTIGSWVATHTVGETDAEGVVAFSIAFRDLAGNAGGAVMATTDASAVTIDLSGPETTLDTTPAALSASGTATFTFLGGDDAGSGVAGFEASLDGGAYAAVTSPLTLTGLADGSHTFSVRAIDAAGNVDATPASFTWTIDTTAPSAPTIASITPTGVSGTAEPGSTVRVYAGATLLGTTTADSSGNWSLALSLADGAYSLTATAFDAAGNSTATTAPTTQAVDTAAPTAPAGLAATVPSPSAIALSWTASTDAVGVAGYRIYRDGVAIGTSATLTYTDTGLTAGTAYTYTVTAYDAAGHESAASAAAVATTQYAGPQSLSVDNTGELVAALATIAANPSANYTLTLASGTYRPATGLTLAGDQVTLHSNGTVVLDGSGLSAGALLTVAGDEVVIHGVTFRQAPAEAIVIAAGAAAGTVADCTFEGAGLSGTGCPGWTITGNTFNDLVGSSASAAAAITFGAGADDLTVTDNVILDCDRGIALTGSAGAKVRNNFIADNRTSGHPGAAIALVEVTDAQIDHNTLYAAGSHANAIEYSGGVAVGAIRNNLTNKPITATATATATATLATNVATAEASWFKDPRAGDLHLAATRSGVVDAGTAIAGFTVDIDGDPRPTGSASDIGADEFQPDTLAPTVPTALGAQATSSGSVVLSWTASTDTAPAGATATGVAGYRIYRNGTAVGTTTSTSYTDTGLSVGTAYSYTVTAFDGAANESARSTAVSVTTVGGTDSGGGKGGGGACGLVLPGALALLLALRRRRR